MFSFSAVAYIVLSGADYETLIEEKIRVYSDTYWQNKTFVPSALLFYVSFNKKLRNVEHHTLFFDEHVVDIYDKPSPNINF